MPESCVVDQHHDHLGFTQCRIERHQLRAGAVEGCGQNFGDFERGFIRAQTIGYQQLVEAGSLAEAKSKGWLRAEGKEYVVAEGDVMEFLFNV